MNKYEVDGADEKSHEIFEDEEKEEDGIGMIEEDELVAAKKVVGNLKRHERFWKDTGFSNFVYSVVSD